MELSELQEEVDDIRPEGEVPSESIPLLMIKVGQMAEGQIRLDRESAKQWPEEARDATHRDLLAGVIIAAVEYAAEHDVDLEESITERLEKMREIKEQHDSVQSAVESGDAAALAEALGADANEVPTGMFEDDDDDAPRGVY